MPQSVKVLATGVAVFSLSLAMLGCSSDDEPTETDTSTSVTDEDTSTTVDTSTSVDDESTSTTTSG